MTDTSKEAVEALIESRWAYRAPDAAPAILLRALMAERDELQAQLQDQALSHLSAMGQLTDQLSAPAHAAKVLLREWEERGEGPLGELNCYTPDAYHSYATMEPDVDGEWVKFDDVKTALRSIAEQDQDT